MIKRIQIFGDPADMGTVEEVEAELNAMLAEAAELAREEAEARAREEEAGRCSRRGMRGIKRMSGCVARV